MTGYIFDDLTEGRFGRGLLNALSTGHITNEVEFENSETGEVLSAEEFRKFNWEEQCNGNWLMAVTKLEWVEFSSVAIGSNRKSLITSRNAIEAFVKSENSVLRLYVTLSKITLKTTMMNRKDAMRLRNQLKKLNPK